MRHDVQRPPYARLLLLGALLQSTVAYAQDGALDSDSGQRAGNPALSDEHQRRADAHLQEVTAGLQDLRNGAVRVREVRTGHVGKAAKETMDYYIAFDRESDSLRFDYRNGPRRTMYARNPREVLVYVPVPRNLPVPIARHGHAERVIFDARPLDLGTVGITFLPLYLQKRPLDETLAVLDENLWGAIPTSLEEQASRIVLAWQYRIRRGRLAGSRGRFDLVLDTEQGNRPVQLRSWIRDPDAEEWKLQQSGDASWKEINGVWVPKTWTMESQHTGKRSELSFEWESVNQAVPAETFEAEAFNAPQGTPIFDHRLGKPVFDRRVGSP